jgi:hypothetical protein
LELFPRVFFSSPGTSPIQVANYALGVISVIFKRELITAGSGKLTWLTRIIHEKVVKGGRVPAITVEMGANIILGQNMDHLIAIVSRILDGQVKKGSIPPLWDGQASEGIAEIVINSKR